MPSGYWGADQEPLMNVGFGLVGGQRRITELGNNPDIDAAPEDVWTGGGLYPWMSAATSLEVVAADAADTSAGTGARTITVSGLSALFVEQTEAVTLNGTTPVALATQFYRINGMVVTGAGSGRTNAGDITLRDAGAGTTRGVIPAGYGITRQSQYTVPAGHTLSVNSILLCINRPAAARDVTVASFIQSQAGVFRLPLEISLSGSAPYRHDGLPGVTIAEKTDFGLRCTYVSQTNTDLTAAWLGVLRQNS